MMQYFQDAQGHIYTSEHVWEGCTRLPRAQGERLYRAQSATMLRKTLKPGDHVYTVLRHVSKSGMSRRISLHVVVNGHICNITWHAAIATGTHLHDKSHAIQIGGCGMDMGFELVYRLGRALYPEGYGVVPFQGGGKRPRTRKQAAQWVAKGVEFYGRNGDSSGWDNDGGYALTQVRL